MPAEGASCLWNLSALGGPGRADGDPAETVNATTFTIMSFHAGGTGARPGRDGLSATAFPSGVRNVPVEVNETISPIIAWKNTAGFAAPATPRRPRPDHGRHARQGAFRHSVNTTIDHPPRG